MAEEFLTEQELMELWQVSKAALGKLVQGGRLGSLERVGRTGFSAEEIAAFEETNGQGSFVTLDEALQRLEIDRDGLDELVRTGELTRYMFGREARFDLVELQSLAQAVPSEGGEEQGPSPAAEEPGPWEEEEDEALFDFGEELEEEVTAEAGPPEAAVEEAEEAPPEGEMIAEVLEVSEEEMAEEDILADILGDIGGGLEPAAAEEETTEEEVVEVTVDDEDTEEITGLAEEIAEPTMGEEETTEITQLGEETFEGEELEDLLAGEEAVEAGELEEEELEVPYGRPVPATETPVATWIVIALLAVLAVQVVGGLYLMGNARLPNYGPSWLSQINPFSE